MKSLIQNADIMALIYEIDDNKLKKLGYKSMSILQNTKDGWEPRLVLIDENDTETSFTGEDDIKTKLNELKSADFK